MGRLKAEFLSALVASDASEENLKLLEKGESSIPARQIRLAAREHRIRLLNAEQALVNLGLAVRTDDFQLLPDIDRAARIHFAGLPPGGSSEPRSIPWRRASNLVPIVCSFDGIVVGRDVGLGESRRTCQAFVPDL